MRIRLTKISDATHRLTAIRDDGSEETIELPSRSFLIHDFIHYAVETTAGLRHSFWGLLASGKTMPELVLDMRPDEAPPEALMRTEPATTELVVGCFTGLAQDRATAAEAVDAVRRLLAAQSRDLPPWLDEAFAETVREKLRRLRGEWRAVPYGGTMELRFPP